ncbi:hypothetical protein [Tanticharoenia sakaeratensis]|jgi:hypothetical protein|uniref:Uncharacterized protein n=1 Tax=Tanticharoenia sakaeratensis NBRC 103193 TaxID=1231623 RepID=A0A0D6ML72_9PROT|nr:hypothetical protein [Tanticharoenia sakaeratensis]GAN54226.1 hypothetical protein Tasa_017_109 [Tanticharoenia sakaeratensis NBRC 103193]GBQ19228.1 hypothetical protein AA103193_0956 [Tanticharoenia sakaeratensis NBRC 103193]
MSFSDALAGRRPRSRQWRASYATEVRLVNVFGRRPGRFFRAEPNREANVPKACVAWVLHRNPRMTIPASRIRAADIRAAWQAATSGHDIQ